MRTNLRRHSIKRVIRKHNDFARGHFDGTWLIRWCFWCLVGCLCDFFRRAIRRDFFGCCIRRDFFGGAIRRWVTSFLAVGQYNNLYPTTAKQDDIRISFAQPLHDPGCQLLPQDIKAP